MLSPSLFNIYIADLDRKLAKKNIEGISLGGERIWSLAYANDIILLAKNKVALEDMTDIERVFKKKKN